MTMVNDGQWLTLTEASNLTGKSINSLRLLIRRKKLTMVRKVRGKRGDEWIIHREAIHDVGQGDQEMTTVTRVGDQGDHPSMPDACHVITLPLEYYERQQKERDQLSQGLLMYRYKFEELDRVVKALPAPPDIIAEEIRQKDSVIKEAQKVLNDAQYAITQKEVALAELKQKLDEAEQAKEHLREVWEQAMADIKKPWWKKALIATGMWK
ncbi:MAG: hypothetical protein RDU59_11860 [Thermodesulfobacteriota bacterium]|nr:hypothetical protein [Thermodesulfobacteriota bacterium]MDQ7839172.1 hypothetical protein [Thermodesulfobacteriota bacterium]